jgi:tetratricopeptide (TPR) repeat protein
VVSSTRRTPNQPVEFVNVSDPTRIAPVTMLRIYGELLDREPALHERYVSLLDQLERSRPDSAIVQAALGRRALLAGSMAEAVAHLRKSESLGYSAHTLYVDLAEALSRAGQHQEAANVLVKAIERDTYAPNLHKSLVLRYIALKDYALARAAMKQYLELFPHDSFMRGLLAKVAK